MVKQVSFTLTRLLLLLALAWNVVTALPDGAGIAEFNDSLLQKHLQSRSKLIEREKLQRQDREFRQSLSPIARQAEKIVAAIRQDEIDNYWMKPAQPGQNETERFAGMMFTKARPYILSTELWKIIQRLPKGALLHSHLSAMLPTEILLNTLLSTEGIVVSSTQDVSTELNQKNATVTFGHVNRTIATTSPSIHSKDYVPGTLIPITIAAESFPGGRDAFIAFLKSKMTITTEESVRHDLGVNDVWRKFQTTFTPLDSAIAYEPIIRTFYQKLFEGLADDGINWVEIRTVGIASTIIPEGEETINPDADFWWRVIAEELEKFKATDKGAEFWGARIIWTDIRSFDRPTLLSAMESALERKQKFPGLISGYDLVAQEDLGRPLIDLAPELLWFREQATALNLTIPFFFHAGETLGDGNATDSNLFDAVLLDSRRIGHGFSLYKHPTLIENVVSNRVLVEVCPISHEVLRLTTDILHHPLPALIAHGIPTAISNDDPANLGQDAPGLSFDFYQVIQAFDNVGLGGLGALAQNSVRWSNFEDQPKTKWLQDIKLGEKGRGIKARRIKEWNQKWEEYCQWIVNEYGGRYNGSISAISE